MCVVNAVLDDTRVVIQSAETAASKSPVEAIKAMVSACISAKKHCMELAFTEISETLAMSAVYAANHLEGVKQFR